MAKKKKTNNTSVLRKGIALLASVVTFIFLFLEIIGLRTEYVNLLKGESEFTTEGIKQRSCLEFLIIAQYFCLLQERIRLFVWLR